MIDVRHGIAVEDWRDESAYEFLLDESKEKDTEYRQYLTWQLIRRNKEYQAEYDEWSEGGRGESWRHFLKLQGYDIRKRKNGKNISKWVRGYIADRRVRYRLDRYFIRKWHFQALDKVEKRSIDDLIPKFDYENKSPPRSFTNELPLMLQPKLSNKTQRGNSKKEYKLDLDRHVPIELQLEAFSKLVRLESADYYDKLQVDLSKPNIVPDLLYRWLRTYDAICAGDCEGEDDLGAVSDEIMKRFGKNGVEDRHEDALLFQVDKLVNDDCFRYVFEDKNWLKGYSLIPQNK